MRQTRRGVDGRVSRSGGALGSNLLGGHCVLSAVPQLGWERNQVRVPVKLLALLPPKKFPWEKKPPKFAWFRQTISSRKTTGLGRPSRRRRAGLDRASVVRPGLDRCLQKARQNQPCSPRESLSAGSSTGDCQCHSDPPALAAVPQPPATWWFYPSGFVPCSSQLELG